MRLILYSAMLAAVIFGTAASSPGSGHHSPTKRTDLLTKEQARTYLLELINRDRATKGLDAVLLDPISQTAAQHHAEEMAVHGYMAHWDLAGKLPDQRYTEAGGADYTRENVFLARSSAGGSPVQGTLELDTAPMFTRAEVEAIDAAYFNEIPPNDGHRRNILAAEHTHLGIGLAKAARDGTDTLANDEEFIDRYLALDPLPSACAPGDSVVVSGHPLGNSRIYSVSVARSPFPHSMSPDELERTRNYSSPRSYATYRPGDDSPAARFVVADDGKFRLAIKLSDDGKPGVYFITLRVAQGRFAYVASQRTVVVGKPDGQS